MTSVDHRREYAELASLGAELSALFDRLARRYANLTLFQYQTLAALRRHHPEPLEPWEIARAVQTGSNYVTKLLDQLAAAGLVERRSHGQDRRRRLVHLTDAGLLRIDELEPRVRDLEDRLLSEALSPDERVELRRLTSRVRRSLADVVVPTERVRPGP